MKRGEREAAASRSPACLMLLLCRGSSARLAHYGTAPAAAAFCRHGQEWGRAPFPLCLATTSPARDGRAFHNTATPAAARCCCQKQTPQFPVLVVFILALGLTVIVTVP